MFQKILDFIGRQVIKIFNKPNIKAGLGVDIIDEMTPFIDKWDKMYKNKASWLKENKGNELQSLGLSASISSEMARLVTIEMESEITGLSNEDGKATENKRSIYLNKQYQKVIDKLRVQTEYCLAKGGLIFKPYIDNGNIAIDYVQADNFFPVGFNSSGDLIAVIFPEVIKKGNKTYTRLEYHHLLPDGTYYISNTAYLGENHIKGLGMPIELTEIDEWKELEPELNIPDVNRTLFSYFRVPLANNKIPSSNIGVSIYSRAEDLIKQADEQYTNILWEYEGSQLAIDVGLDMIKNNRLPKRNERVFRKLDAEDDDFYKVFNPTIRDESLFNGLNQLLRKIEFNVGLAYGTLSNMEEVAKTATEIVSSKQRSYATIVDIQKALQTSLEHLIESMNFLTGFYGLSKKGEYEVSFHWDDSIVVDTQSEIAMMMQEVSAGLIKPEYYLMKRYGLDEEQAKKMLPNMNPPQGEYDDIE